ncbi:hypothetical protein, partial [Yersinia mollaretii]
LDSFTVERLEELIKSASLEPCDAEPIYDNVQVRELAALARIALAAKRAEPVAWTSQRSLETKNKIVAFTDDMSALDYGTANGWADIVELYTTPQLNSPEIPDGWKLVPIEPNWEMLSADGCKEHHKGETCLHHDNRKRIWQAMLAAAPEKPL